MRQFASSGMRVWHLSREARLVYTAFGVFSMLALVSSVAFYEDLVGHEQRGVRAYYAGEASTGSAALAPARPKPPSPSGPAIDMPDEDAPPSVPGEARPERLTVAVSYRKLLEVTHFHLFTIPVFLLIITHLFMLTGLAPATKMAWIAGGYLTALVHIAAPWVVRYGGGGWAFLYVVSGVGLFVSSTVLTAYPIWAMWFGRPPSPLPSPVQRPTEESLPG
jgi:hypothetical protein